MKRSALRLIASIAFAAFASSCARNSPERSNLHAGHNHEESGSSKEHSHEKAGARKGEHADKSSHEDHHESQHPATAEVAFKEGRGLTLSPAVVTALGLKTIEAEERSLAAAMKITAQVFAAKPEVLASASVTPEEAQRLEHLSFLDARIVRLDRTATAATKLVDVIFALNRIPPPAIGEFDEIRVASEPQKVLSVPSTSVLDAAIGTFVYVVHRNSYLRTAVTTGRRSPEFVEIVQGIKSGETVVSAAVEQLWLTELRLTKGGGHSH